MKCLSEFLDHFLLGDFPFPGFSYINEINILSVANAFLNMSILCNFKSKEVFKFLH